MELEICCVSCGTDIGCDAGGDGLNATVDCECGARYAVTISRIRP
jgi:hypothetical protein